jgi:hypothetical protein
VLVVAHKTAATSPLLDAVRARAAQGPCTFTLLVPNPARGLHKVVDPEDQGGGEARGVLDRALPMLSEAAGSQVQGIVGDPDPMAAVQDALNLRGFTRSSSPPQPPPVTLADALPAQQGAQYEPSRDHRDPEGHLGGKRRLTPAPGPHRPANSPRTAPVSPPRIAR